MKLTNLNFFFFGLILVITGFFTNPNLSFAVSREEMIRSLMEQIKVLQAQIIHLQNNSDIPSRWCYDFNSNLRIGEKGKEIIALHKALENNGFGSFDRGGDDFNAFEVFTEETASAVVGFQQKYKDEILTPNGLQYGTGFVGPSTRKKLNSLYGCKNSSSSSSSSKPNQSITLISPNGGERLEINKTYPIKWQSKNLSDFDSLSINLISYSSGAKGVGIFTNKKEIAKVANTGYYEWTISESIIRDIGINPNSLSGTEFDPDFKIEMSVLQKGFSISDSIDYYFNIINSSQASSSLSSSQSSSSSSSSSTASSSSSSSATTTNPSITVFYPKGGENMVTGDPILIRWTTAVSVSIIEIVSTAGNYSFGIYGPKYGNTVPITTGEYTYTVVNTTPAGLYYVRITPADGSMQAVSKTFTINQINQPSINVLSPNGGEIYGAGDTTNIQWNTNAISAQQDMTIRLVTTDASKWTSSCIEQGVVAGIIPSNLNARYVKNSCVNLPNSVKNTGSYSWEIPRIIPADSYRILINELKIMGETDNSDQLFIVTNDTSS